MTLRPTSNCWRRCWFRTDTCFSGAGSGGEALETIARDPPDLVLLDLIMPSMDGLDVCRVLPADPYATTRSRRRQLSWRVGTRPWKGAYRSKSRSLNASNRCGDSYHPIWRTC